MLIFEMFLFYLNRRHVLRFLIQAPLGYRVDICSQTPFVFGDEDLVMYQLTKVDALLCLVLKLFQRFRLLRFYQPGEKVYKFEVELLSCERR